MTCAWDLDELHSSGIAAILSVNDGEAVHESLLDSLGIAYATIPMSGNAPVRAGDQALCLRNLPRAMAFIGDNLDVGPVLVHCRSGKDRTGLVLAAYLMAFEGCSASEAMDQVLEVRPIAFSAEGWMTFVRDVLKRFETDILSSPR